MGSEKGDVISEEFFKYRKLSFFVSKNDINYGDKKSTKKSEFFCLQ